jgi:uncharacterized coiled-coil protein SlyX
MMMHKKDTLLPSYSLYFASNLDDVVPLQVSSIEAAPEPTEADDELAADDAMNALAGSEAELAARIATLETQLAESEAAKTGLSTQLDAALEASETTKAELSTRLEAVEKDKVGLAAQLAAARATVGAPSPTPSTPKAAITHEVRYSPLLHLFDASKFLK